MLVVGPSAGTDKQRRDDVERSVSAEGYGDVDEDDDEEEPPTWCAWLAYVLRQLGAGFLRVGVAEKIWIVLQLTLVLFLMSVTGLVLGFIHSPTAYPSEVQRATGLLILGLSMGTGLLISALAPTCSACRKLASCRLAASREVLPSLFIQIGAAERVLVPPPRANRVEQARLRLHLLGVAAQHLGALAVARLLLELGP